ncbi:TPA: hypothetical protein JG832_002470 [Enterobacter hormaechei subsp. xiangfangensis]|nr:hypothetical protein [Enterobacter hormaechei subsp. xiangfangensis]HAV1890605.1 hypothetical protein [Enterobacter hormaechei subsp. xiangfangensis]
MKRITALTAIVLALAGTTLAQASDLDKPLTKKQIARVEAGEGVKDLGCKSYVGYGFEYVQPSQKFKAVKPVLKKDQLFEGSKSQCNVFVGSLSDDITVNPEEVIKFGDINVTVDHGSASASVRKAGDEIDLKHGWDVFCQRDEIDDQKSCIARQFGLTIIKKAGIYSVYVGTDLTPGSESALRVDKDTALTTTDSNGLLTQIQTDTFLKTVKPDSKVIARFQIWPKDRSEVFEIEAGTLGTALKVLNAIDANF